MDMNCSDTGYMHPGEVSGGTSTVDTAAVTVDVVETLDFLAQYCRRLLGSGVHTSRVIRNACRIAECRDMDLHVLVTVRCLILTLRHCHHHEVATRVVAVPALPISFELNSALSALSWEAYDGKWGLDRIRSRYEEIIHRPARSPWIVLVLLALANGAFCRLFGGDWLAIAFVAVATAVGFRLKLWLVSRHVNHFFVTALCAFVASMTASPALLTDCTAQIALATSPLFLVPGVPLINSVIDTVEGHVLTGMSRLATALLTVVCIAIGLACTLLLVCGGVNVAV